MAAKITFFSVGCGDMTLIKLADFNATTILIDTNIRVAADDVADSTPDVATALRKRLLRDDNGRPFVNVFLLSHPDKDHCTGLRKHFWLGDPEDYPDDKLPDAEKRIIIRELWSSPMVFRRHTKKHTLCEDAKAFNSEARRRVAHWRDYGSAAVGNQILIMGEDENGKTDDLGAILIKCGGTFSTINREAASSSYFSARLLAPMPRQDDDGLEETLSKNHSSVILNIEVFASQNSSSRTRFLTGGDAEVEIWRRLWDQHKDNSDVLGYDLLLAPHHCSWHSLSSDSWSQLKEDAKVCPDARSALGQARDGATIVASSKEILDDDVDPPCIRAKQEYKAVLKPVGGVFLCTADDAESEVLEFEIKSWGGLARIVVAGVGITGSAVAAAAPRAGAHDE
jgi:hypothetical protein